MSELSDLPKTPQARVQNLGDMPYAKREDFGELVPLSLRPLHVRVAEALGWGLVGGTWHGPNGETYAALGGPCRVDPIPRYDTDWSAAGTLLEKLLATNSPLLIHSWKQDDEKPAAFQAYLGGVAMQGWGATPIEAVCHLVLALAEAGKLPR